LLEEFLFGNHTVAMLEEVDEHCKYLGLDGDLLARAAQLTVLRVEFVVTEAVDHVRYPEAIPQPFPREDTFYSKNGKPSSHFHTPPLVGQC